MTAKRKSSASAVAEPDQPTSPPNWSIRSKIWIENERGDVLFGAGRLRILESVERHGSILGAAKELGMSYRAVWGKIKATERRLGQSLLKRKVGGARGGGSELTPLGKALIQRFQDLQNTVEHSADELFKDFVADMTDRSDPSS